MLEPELQRMRVTEERRQERRMRQQQLQQSAAETSPEYVLRHPEDTVQPFQLYEQNSNTADSVPDEKTRSTMSFQIQGQGQSQGQGHPGVLVIDPRNRGDEE